MAEPANKEFGKRKAVAATPAHTAKRSGHVALLLMGTVAVGGGAYTLMPGENCEPNRPGMASGAECASRGGSSTSSGSSRYGFFMGDSSTSRSASTSTPASASDGVTRGGFGSFGRAFMAHFSVGG